jgi:transcription initiation factor TFIIE subunit alpha
MNLLDKLIEDFISEVIGGDVLEVVRYLKKRDNVSEFKLAEKLDLTVNQIRNMLYRLYSYSLVDFTRKKDKKKGWYIYYWDFYVNRALDTALGYKKERVALLKDLLKKEETGQHFICPDKDVRLSFEQAIEHDFKCPECDKVLIQESNTRKVQTLTKSIAELEEEIKGGSEIVIEKKKPKKSTRKKAKPKRKPAKRKPARKKAKPKRKSTKKKAKPKKKSAKRKPARKNLLKKNFTKKKKT